MPAGAQKLTTTRILRIKTLDEEHVDTSISLKGSLLTDKKDNTQGLSFTIGYGQLLGKSWMQPKSNWGLFGSGLLNSDLFGSVSRLGPEYTQNVRDFGWGKNGLNFSLDGKFGKFSLGGGYSGYLDAYSFNFSGTIGSFTGKGIIISQSGKVEEIRSDMEIKF